MYLEASHLISAESFVPLKVVLCQSCWLLQTQDFFKSADLFTEEYAYFSSTSFSWLEHAKRFVENAIERFELKSSSFVVEIASNDGYLLRNFVDAQIPCLGIEPTVSTHTHARSIGIDSICEFFSEVFSEELLNSRPRADLVIANNVFAHIPDCVDFARGIRNLLADDGVVSLEVHHAMNLLQKCQFDTIYHEHYSYHSVGSIMRIFEAVGLRVFDVEEIPTHGGSIRVYGCKSEAQHGVTKNVARIRQMEIDAGLETIHLYSSFAARVLSVKLELLTFLIEQKRHKRKVMAYGAAAKGNTLLNYCGIGTDLVSHVFDAAPSKQGKFMPGSRIPIMAPSEIENLKPDVVLILPWNIAGEIKEQLLKSGHTSIEYFTPIPIVKRI